MSENLLVSSRGQITLPAEIRKRFGIKPGDVVLLEEQHGALSLRPAAVLPIEIYSDKQIAAWDAADQLGDSTRKKILKKLKSTS
ncbi:MAG: AbrB/MazE/SpoVT family DNA-binding domain-containing protein [Thiothrix sp.]|nr:MAG: AbrB/MazE/SpoVT family DNA-binding domain-containing protein [Thiothrix sp.]